MRPRYSRVEGIAASRPLAQFSETRNGSPPRSTSTTRSRVEPRRLVGKHLGELGISLGMREVDLADRRPEAVRPWHIEVVSGTLTRGAVGCDLSDVRPVSPVATRSRGDWRVARRGPAQPCGCGARRAADEDAS